MQADTVSLAGRVWVGAVLALRDRGWLAPEGRHEVLALDLLAQWDGTMVPESGGAAVYMLWRRALLRELYEAQVGDLAAGYLGQRAAPRRSQRQHLCLPPLPPPYRAPRAGRGPGTVGR